jgi:ArsR family transcriptional regulator
MASMLKSLKLLSDPTRLRILMLVGSEALSVAELQEILGMGQSREEKEENKFFHTFFIP